MNSLLSYCTKHIMSGVYCSLILFTSACIGHAHVEKIFYHVMKPITAKKDDRQRTLELAKLVLCFSDKFLLSELPEGIVPQSKGYKTLAFILPGVTVVSPELQKELTKYVALDERHFRISVTSIQVPTQGLSIKISYEPEWIELAVDQFKTIGNQPALMITCYDKKSIEKLKNMNPTILQMASLDRPTIIVDCGHGGHDTGACGFFNIKEKELVKRIGDRLEHELKKRGWSVVMTRHGDEFVSLDKRTLKINSENNALVAISLHANSAPSERAHGIETFYYDPTFLVERVKGFKEGLSYCMEMSDNTSGLSKKLAVRLQESLISSVSALNPDVVDRNVKQGTAQVLLGSSIPTVLVEMGFISNRKEARLLADQDYQKLIVAGLILGLEGFVNDMKPLV